METSWAGQRVRGLWPRLGRALHTHDPVRHVARFLTVGLLGTLVDVGLFAGLHSGLGVPAVAANVLSYSAGIVNNYLLHRNWTYADRRGQANRRQAAQFALVSLSALLLNTGLVLLLTGAFAPFLAPAYASLLAKVCATVAGLGWNFIGNQYWTFRSKQQG